MSETGKKDVGYPRSQDDTRKFQLLLFCGGMGGGDCVTLLSGTSFVYSIKVPKFLVYNKSLILENPEFTGVEIFTDAGAADFCDHSAGTRVSWWLGFSDDGILTDQQVIDQGIEITGAPPHQIEVQGLKLPQPVLLGGGVNPDWENRIYIHIVWGVEGYVASSELIDGILKIAKHDYDVKV